MLTQVTKETHNGYEWLVPTDFDDIESVAYWLEDFSYPYTLNGFSLSCDLDHFRKAENAYLEYCDWVHEMCEYLEIDY